MIKKILGLTVIVLLIAGSIFFWGFTLGGDQQAWIYLDRLGLFLGIIAFIPMLYAIWVYIQYTRREEKERKRIHTDVGTQPAVLIVDVGGAGIRNEVESFLKNEKGFESFDFDAQVFVVHRDEQQITSDDVDSIIQDVDQKLSSMRLKAVDKIHLFLKAPMPIVVMVGEVLANQTPTLVYHKQRNKGYENWGALHR